MKVIQEGKGKWSIQVTCNGDGNGKAEREGACGALLEVEADDIFKTQRQSYGDEYPEIFYTIQCPLCKTWTDISPSRIPGYIQEEAKRRSRFPSERSINNILK